MHDCVEQAVLAEKVGFDRVWAVEHHCLKWYAHMSAPETFLAFVAAKTKRIRIGHGVVCLPFRMNHPVKVAERVAMLDILSKGRVDFGVGKGGTLQEAGAFQTEMEEIPAQLEESARMIPRMWREEEFEHKSELIDIPPRPIVPKPLPGAAPADVSRLHAREHAEPGRRVGARRARARLRRARGHRAEEPRVPRGGEAAHAQRRRCPSSPSSTCRRCAPRSCSTTTRRRARSATAASASSPRRSGTGTTRAPTRRRRAPRSPT